MQSLEHINQITSLLERAMIFNHGHLPVAAAYCRYLGLVDLVDQMVASKMALRPGLAVQAMVLDVLSGRTPLYRVEQFMAGQDVELLLGEAVDPHAFNDTNLARSMDAVFASGSSKIITELGIRATRMFHLDATTPSYDTTSTSVWGEYRVCEQQPPPPGPLITFGHSKDALPQLKQFMTELLCVDRGVPIFGRTLDGNSSDKTSNTDMLSRIGSVMSRLGLGPGAFVYVADSAMITEENLLAIGENRFVSRLPATYKECARAIGDAVDAQAWINIGALAEIEGSRKRPSARYKAFETTVTLYAKTYRALVVHSNAHDKRRQKKLDKALCASEKSIGTEIGKLCKITFFCEADAKTAATKAVALSNDLHTLTATISPIVVRRRGRPPSNAPAPTHTRYALSCALAQNAQAIERQRDLAGCFVLISNVPAEGHDAMDASRLLLTYKGQYGVESDFAFLKDPLVVNDLFIKTPARIDVLGMVLIIALMIWRLMERSMRAYVANEKTKITGWDNKKTTKPTTFMMTTYLTGIQVAHIDGQRFMLRSPQPAPLDFLKALGVTPEAFLNPLYKCCPIIPANNSAKG